MKTYFRILSFSRPLRGYLPFYIVSSFISIVFGLINLMLIKPLLDVIFEQLPPEKLQAYSDKPVFRFKIEYFENLFNFYMYTAVDEYGKWGALMYVCVVIIISVFIANLFRYIAAVILAGARIKIIKNLRLNLFRNLSVMHLGYFTEQKKGDILSRASNDIQQIESSVQQSLKVLFREPATIIIYFAFLFYMSYNLTLFTLIILPISGGIIAEIAKRLKKSARENQESLGRILNIIDETLGGMRVIKAFNAVPYINNVFRKEVRHYADINYSYSRRFELAGPISEFLGVFAVVGILIYGGNLVINQDSISPSSFITYLTIFTQVLQPAKHISAAVTSIQRGIASAERIFSITDEKPKIIDNPDAAPLKEFNDCIEFRKVSFAYENEKVLKDINLTIPKGRTIALVGPSGGGKSTLADLIPRFYDPVEGHIYIDGKDSKSYQLDSIRALMGIVTQESILFNDTVFNNIAFGLQDADEQEVIKAAKIANADEFIQQMENGYQTIIGERGSKLSGGQRQRLSIARAILKNPPILILDEATSALDTRSEKLVQEALTHLMQNRTSVVIAHRLSTIQNADHIVVIKNGEIVEQGNHNGLMQARGIYFGLIEMQSF